MKSFHAKKHDVVEQRLQAAPGHHGEPPRQRERRKDSLQDETQ